MLEVQARERPILFNAEMVRAILAGRKTQTRRVVKPQPTNRLVEPRVGLTIGMDPADDGAVWYDADGIHPGREVRCPHGSPLDRLWVREAWAETYDAARDEEVLWYRADGQEDLFRAECARLGEPPRWRPSIHMPRWASRITLEITDVRVERVQEITEEDAQAEGVGAFLDVYRDGFRDLWDSLNAARGYGWDMNPWVWVLSFRRIEEVYHA